MNHKKRIAVTIAFTVCAFAGSNAMAQQHGGFRSGGFNGGGFRGGSAPVRVAPSFTRAGSRVAPGMTRSGTFRSGDRDRHHHYRDLDDRFFFFDDFGDPFFYYPYSYYGYYPYCYYPYDYGYDSYNQPVYQATAGYTDSLVRQVQLRLANAGYYHGSIDGVSGNGTRRAISEYGRSRRAGGRGDRKRIAQKQGLGVRSVAVAY